MARKSVRDLARIAVAVERCGLTFDDVAGDTPASLWTALSLINPAPRVPGDRPPRPARRPLQWPRTATLWTPPYGVEIVGTTDEIAQQDLLLRHDIGARRVASTELRWDRSTRVLVSTVFLWWDTSFGDGPDRKLWQTAVRVGEDSFVDRYFHYGSWEAAKAGHRLVVRMVRQVVRWRPAGRHPAVKRATPRMPFPRLLRASTTLAPPSVREA